MRDELKKYLDEAEDLGIRKGNVLHIDLNIKPFFKEDIKKKLDKKVDPFSELDELGRSRVAFTCIVGKEVNSGEIPKFKCRAKPTGWKSIGCDYIDDGKCLYNRCHLIARQFYNKKVDKRGLITGTRSFNIKGMFEYEDIVSNYIKDNPEHHILYRVTPYYKGDNDLLPYGVQMEILDIDDEEKFSYNVLVYNKQPGFDIDYRNGDVYSDNPLSLSGKRLGNNIYVINRDTNRFHKESCACVRDIKNKLFFAGEKQTIEEKYCKCKNCIH